MAIKYLDAKRIRGVASDKATLVTAVSPASDWTESGSKYTLTDNQIDFALKRDGSHHYAYVDLGADASSTWVLRMHVNFTGNSSGDGYSKESFWGLSSTTGNFDASQDSAGAVISFTGTGGSGDNRISVAEGDNQSLVDDGTRVTVSNLVVTPTSEWWLELKRTASATITLGVYSESTYTTLVSNTSVTSNTAFSGTGLRYVKFAIPDYANQGEIQNGTVDTIEFYDNMTTASGTPTKFLSGASTDLPENTLFEETDTQMIYGLSSGGWTKWYGTDGVRGCNCIGDDGGNSNVIDFVNIDTVGNATDFGDSTLARFDPATFADATRGVIAGGGTSASQNTIDYFTVATESNSSDFGDLITAVKHNAGVADATRGCSCGGVTSSYADGIEYVTIQTTGGGTFFGDLTATTGAAGGLADATRGIIAGGYQGGTVNVIQYLTIASTGNASDFGDLTVQTRQCAGFADATRGIIGGGQNQSGNVINTIDYITIQSAGNATDFGDLTVAKQEAAGFANATRGCFAGGSTGSVINVIEYITIQTAGNGTDFGDITVARRSCSGLAA